MTQLSSVLLARWATVVPRSSALGLRLVDAYSQPHRHYHNGDHLLAVLERIDELEGRATKPRLVRLAAWFHDAVYDATSGDNEEASARLAERSLAKVGLAEPEIAEIARLVRLTATHSAAPHDNDGAVLCDADLAILASDAARYRAYSAAVRKEYSPLSDADFRSGRADLLERLLALPHIFQTERGHRRWEDRARTNLSSELAQLRR